MTESAIPTAELEENQEKFKERQGCSGTDIVPAALPALNVSLGLILYPILVFIKC